MKKEKRWLFAWGPTFLWMAVIFWLSSFNKLQVSAGTEDFILRKLAHMTEYVVLFGLFCRSFKRTVKLTNRENLLIALILTVLYAATDEYHQTFVQGRSGRLFDIGIDCLGAIGGLLLAVKTKFLSWRIWN